MDVFKAIKKRRSIRKYQEKAIEEEVLNKVLEAARWAPSWANVQATRWLVVTHDGLKAKLAETLSPGNPSHKAIIKAPVVLALCYEKGLSGYYKGEQSTSIENWGLFDAGLAAANLTLAAQALGLGTVHVGAINLENAAEALDLPDDVQLVELIPLGYPDGEGFVTSRKELSKIVFREQYGNEYEPSV